MLSRNDGRKRSDRIKSNAPRPAPNSAPHAEYDSAQQYIDCLRWADR